MSTSTATMPSTGAANMATAASPTPTAATPAAATPAALGKLNSEALAPGAEVKICYSAAGMKRYFEILVADYKKIMSILQSGKLKTHPLNCSQGIVYVELHNNSLRLVGTSIEVKPCGEAATEKKARTFPGNHYMSLMLTYGVPKLIADGAAYFVDAAGGFHIFDSATGLVTYQAAV